MLVLKGAVAAAFQTRFQIDVAYNYRNIVAVQQEQVAMLQMWQSCCQSVLNATTINIATAGDGGPPPPPPPRHTRNHETSPRYQKSISSHEVDGSCCDPLKPFTR